MNKHLILVVDDEVMVTDRLKAALEKTGLYEVITATDGKAALEIVKSHKKCYGIAKNAIECVITDIKMPNMGGLEFARAIRTTEGLHHLPIVLLSAYEDQKKWFQAIDPGKDGAQVTEYLIKPVKREKLYKVLETIVIEKKGTDLLEETRERKFPLRLSEIARALDESAANSELSNDDDLRQAIIDPVVDD